ncbi:MAG: hypothetical protein ACI350_01900 [Prevotella sp.]
MPLFIRFERIFLHHGIKKPAEIICHTKFYHNGKTKEKVSRVDSHEKHMDEFRDAVTSIKTLPCTNHMQDIERHESEQRGMGNRITKVETSIEYLQRSVDTLTKNLQSGNKLILDKYTESHSPLSISAGGREMMRRVGMQAMFDENWERIKALIDEGVSDKNPYDIDQFCQEQSVVFPEKFLKKNQLDVLKADAYREGLTLTSYMRVIAVLSRDKYMEIHGMNK